MILGLATVILLSALIVAAAGCNRGDSKSYETYIAQAGKGMESTSTGGSPLSVIELAGESLISRNSESRSFGNARTRTAALIDALRKLAEKRGNPPGRTDEEGIMINNKCRLDLDGLNISSRTDLRSGVVISDIVDVTLSDDENRPIAVWCMNNLKLVKPVEDDDPELSILQEAMTERGFELVRNQRLGENIWRETVNYRFNSEQ